MPVTPIRPQQGALRWRDVEVLAYKGDGVAPFRDVTRQLLFDLPDLACQLRYFEVAPGGHTTLERHEHAHAVVIEHGRGRVLVGEAIHDVAPHDLVHVPALTWHQFVAADDAPLTPEELARLCADPALAAFVRT